MKRALAILLGLTILLSPLYLVRLSIGSIPVYLPEWSLLLSVVIWIYLLVRRQIVWSSPPPWLAITSIAFVAVMAIVTAFNPNTLGAFKSWVFLPAIFGLVTHQLLANDPPSWWTLRRCLQTALILVVVWGLIDLLTYGGRLQSFFNSPNAAAMWLVPLFFLTLPKADRWSGRTLWLIAATAVVLTRSAGGVMAMLLGTAVWVMLPRVQAPAKTLTYVLAAIVIGLAALSLTPALDQVVRMLFGDSVGARYQIWEVARHAVVTQPLLGVGPGGFEEYYFSHVGSVVATPLEWGVPQPHNLYLATIIAGGVGALLAFLGLVIAAAYRQIKTGQPALLAATTTVIVHGLVDTQYWKNDLALLFFLLMALTALPRPQQV